MNRNSTKRNNLLKSKNKSSKLPNEETIRKIVDYSKVMIYKKTNSSMNFFINQN